MRFLRVCMMAWFFNVWVLASDREYPYLYNKIDNYEVWYLDTDEKIVVDRCRGGCRSNTIRISKMNQLVMDRVLYNEDIDRAVQKLANLLMKSSGLQKTPSELKSYINSYVCFVGSRRVGYHSDVYLLLVVAARDFIYNRLKIDAEEKLSDEAMSMIKYLKQRRMSFLAEKRLNEFLGIRSARTSAKNNVIRLILVRKTGNTDSDTFEDLISNSASTDLCQCASNNDTTEYKYENCDDKNLVDILSGIESQLSNLKGTVDCTDNKAPIDQVSPKSTKRKFPSLEKSTIRSQSTPPYEFVKIQPNKGLLRKDKNRTFTIDPSSDFTNRSLQQKFKRVLSEPPMSNSYQEPENSSCKLHHSYNFGGFMLCSNFCGKKSQDEESSISQSTIQSEDDSLWFSSTISDRSAADMFSQQNCGSQCGSNGASSSGFGSDETFFHYTFDNLVPFQGTFCKTGAKSLSGDSEGYNEDYFEYNDYFGDSYHSLGPDEAVENSAEFEYSDEYTSLQNLFTPREQNENDGNTLTKDSLSVKSGDTEVRSEDTMVDDQEDECKGDGTYDTNTTFYMLTAEELEKSIITRNQEVNQFEEELNSINDNIHPKNSQNSFEESGEDMQTDESYEK